MIQITEAVLIRFGKFQSVSLSFQNGLQVIYGGNEAGKSTLQLFLKVMLYGISGSKKDERGLKVRERIIPWEEKSAEGILRLIADGKNLEIRRKFGKTAAGDKTEILDSNTGSIIADYDPKQLGEQLLGVPESIFEKTFWLHQDGAFFGEADDVLNRRLLNLLETGAEDVSAERTLSWLEREKRALKAKDKRSNPGELDRYRDLREEKVKERYQLLSDMHQREAEERRLAEEKVKLETAKTEIERLKNLAEQKSRILELDAGKKKLEQAQRMLEFARQVEAREDYQKFQALNESLIEKVEILEKKIETLDQMDAIEYDIRQTEERISMAQEREKKNSFFLVVGIALLVVAMFFSVIHWGWTVFFGTVGLFLIGSALFHGQRAKKIAWEKAEEKTRILAERESAVRERDALVADYQSILESYGCKNAQDLYAGFLRYRQSAIEAEGFRKTYESLMEDEDAQTLSGKIQEADEILAKYEDLLKADLDTEMQRMQEIQLSAVSNIKEIEGKLSYVFHGNRNPADAETEILQIDQKILDLEKKEKALDLATAVFTRVHEKRKSDFTPFVNEKVNGFLDILTGGKYQDVRVSEEYQLKLFPDEHHLYPAEYFSKGTYEQTYFALRLALGSLLGDGTEPLFLDDFLIAYDDTRAELALGLLQKLAKERQIFLFTCHQRDAKNAEKLDASIHCLEEE